MLALRCLCQADILPDHRAAGRHLEVFSSGMINPMHHWNSGFRPFRTRDSVIWFGRTFCRSRYLQRPAIPMQGGDFVMQKDGSAPPFNECVVETF